MTQIIDGKAISTQIKDELKEQVAKMKAEGITLCLAVIQVGADPASCVYVRNKKKACEYIGIESLSYELPEETTQEELLNLIKDMLIAFYNNCHAALFRIVSRTNCKRVNIISAAAEKPRNTAENTGFIFY